MFPVGNNLRLSLNGSGLGDVGEISRLAASIPARELVSTDFAFVQYGPGLPTVDDFRFRILRLGSPSPDVAILENWWAAVQNGNLQRKTLTVEVLSSDFQEVGFHAELRDVIPTSWDPLSLTMTVRIDSMALVRLHRGKFPYPSASIPATFNYRLEVGGEPLSTSGDLSGGNTVVDSFNYSSGPDKFAHATPGQFRVAPISMVVNLGSDDVMESWIQSVLLGRLDWPREIVATLLSNQGAPIDTLLHLIDAFPTRVVFLDPALTNSLGEIALAVAVTAQANGSQQ